MTKYFFHWKHVQKNRINLTWMIQHELRKMSLYLPCAAIFTDGLSRRNNNAFSIAGTAFTGYTLAFLVHVSFFRTATAIHCGEVDLTGVVSVAEGTAGKPTAGRVVIIHSFCCTWCTECLCYERYEMFIQWANSSVQFNSIQMLQKWIKHKWFIKICCIQMSCYFCHYLK